MITPTTCYPPHIIAPANEILNSRLLTNPTAKRWLDTIMGPLSLRQKYVIIKTLFPDSIKISTITKADPYQNGVIFLTLDQPPLIKINFKCIPEDISSDKPNAIRYYKYYIEQYYTRIPK